MLTMAFWLMCVQLIRLGLGGTTGYRCENNSSDQQTEGEPIHNHS